MNSSYQKGPYSRNRHPVIRDGEGRSHGGGNGPASARINIEDSFLNHCRREKIEIHVHTLDRKQCTGTIVGFDPHVIAMEMDGCQQLVFKSAISQITPVRNVNYIFNDGRHTPTSPRLRTDAEYADDLT